MDRLKEHHAVAVMLLVGRSLPTGMPWSLDEDRAFIAQERLLWSSLTEEERKSEQDFLFALWGKRGADRKVPVAPEWGPWTSGLGPEITIPDAAFGAPRQDFRPASKGIPDDAPPHLAKTFRWLWEMGFQVIDAEGEKISLVIPSGRLVQEAERLTALLVKTFPKISVRPFGSPDGVQVRSVWDPVSGQATIEVAGLSDSVLC